MNRLWVRLSLAFSAVVIVSFGIILVINSLIIQAFIPQFVAQRETAMINSLQGTLADYYEANGSWNNISLALSTLESLFPPGEMSVSLTLTDTEGRQIYGTQNPLQAQEARHFTLQSGDEHIGDLTISNYLLPNPDLDSPQVTALLRTMLLIVAFVGSTTGLLFGVLMSRTLTAPLDRLSEAAVAIRDQKLNRRVEIKGSTEINALAAAFNDMAQALEQNERLRRNLVADIAHELRTPLVALQGNLYAILDDVYPMTKAEITNLYDQSLLLSRLVDDLRELSQAEADQLSLNQVPFDLAHLVEQTADVFQPIAAGKDISLVINGTDTLALVNADQSRISQVLHNLLNNALMHTPNGGQITLAIVSEADKVILKVSDTGNGIAAEHLPYVFDRFYRADAARSRVTGGSGLGLAIVKAIIEKHQGRVAVASDGVIGKGTLFTIQLPLITEK